MHKPLTGLAATAALSLFATTASADCFDGHAASASVVQKQGSVAVSTHDGTPPPIAETEKEAAVTAAQTCAEGDANCTPAAK